MAVVTIKSVLSNMLSKMLIDILCMLFYMQSLGVASCNVTDDWVTRYGRAASSPRIVSLILLYLLPGVTVMSAL